MSTQTTNYNLIKPELTDAADITQMNPNWDLIDEQLKEQADRLDNVSDELTPEGIGALPSSTTPNDLEAYSLNNAKSITSGADLNNYTVFSNYVATSAVSATLKNCPITAGFVLHVERNCNATSSYCMQRIVTYEAGVEYIRRLSNGTWSEWGMVYTTANKPALTDLSGTLPVANGGTGATTFTSGAALIGAGTGAVTTRSITNNTATSTAITANTNLVTANTLRYAINRTSSVAAADTSYTTLMARGMSLHTSDTNPSVNGAIAWTYK